jgi:hypothetical protein
MTSVWLNQWCLLDIADQINFRKSWRSFTTTFREGRNNRRPTYWIDLNMKMAIFWDIAPCNLVKFYRRFRGACCLHHKSDELWVMTCRPDDEGSKHLWNVGKLLPDYTAQHPRRQPSSYSLPWEPQILLSHLHTSRRECLKSHHISKNVSDRYYSGWCSKYVMYIFFIFESVKIEWTFQAERCSLVISFFVFGVSRVWISTWRPPILTEHFRFICPFGEILSQFLSLPSTPFSIHNHPTICLRRCKWVVKVTFEYMSRVTFPNFLKCCFYDSFPA